MKLYIKYMVSIRCKMLVKEELEKVGLLHAHIDLGQVEFEEDITPEQREKLRMGLLRSGLELMDDKKSILIEKIKGVIVEVVHYNEVQKFASGKLTYMLELKNRTVVIVPKRALADSADQAKFENTFKK